MTPRERKIVPSSRNVRKTVRNVIRKTPHFIALFMVKTKATTLGSAKSSRQALKIKNPKYLKSDYKNKFKDLNLLEREASHQRAKYPKYKKLNKAFAKKNTPKEETVIIYDTSDSNYSSSSEAHN